MATIKTIEEDEKWVGNIVKMNLTTTLINVNSPTNIQTVVVIIRSTRDLVSWKLEKEILALNHENNIPYYEAKEIVSGSQTITYSQTVQRGKIPPVQENKYEQIVKKLIQLEPNDWKSFVNEIKASLDHYKIDTIKVAEAQSKLKDLTTKKKSNEIIQKHTHKSYCSNINHYSKRYKISYKTRVT